MRIMAGSAPHFSPALACAPAQSELLDMTDYFERLRMRRIRRGIGNINRKDIFELLACLEITKLLARVENPRLSTNMTLLANAIPSSRRELLRIHDRMRHRIAQVSFSRTMTPLARYSLLLKWRGFIAVQSSSNRFRPPGMAKQTFRRDGSIEIRPSILLISRRHVPNPAICVIGNRRLEQMIANLNQISERMRARADNVRQLVIGARTMPLHMLNRSVAVRSYGESAVRHRMQKRARRLWDGRRERMRHCRTAKSCHFLGVALRARMTTPSRQSCYRQDDPSKEGRSTAHIHARIRLRTPGAP